MKITTSLMDKELLGLIRERDIQAFNSLYKMKYPIIKKMILKKGGKVEDVKDIFQDTLMVFYKNVQKDDFELTSSISTYLFAIANNLWLKEINKRSKIQANRKEIVGFYQKKAIAFSPYDYDNSEKELKFSVMEKIIKELKDPCKSLLVNFYFKKKSMAQIATEMGYKSASAAKKQKFKCMERVRKLALLEMNKMKVAQEDTFFKKQTG